MALFKVNRGTSTNLPVEMHDGWAYFCTDTAEFFIDYADPVGELHRKQINANEAKKLIGYDVVSTLNDNEDEIPTSSAVSNAIEAMKVLLEQSDANTLTAARKDIITIEGGASTATLADIFGEPPYTIEFTNEEDELSNITVAAGNDYATYRLRNVAILTEAPTIMNDGDIALVIRQEG